MCRILKCKCLSTSLKLYDGLQASNDDVNATHVSTFSDYHTTRTAGPNLPCKRRSPDAAVNVDTRYERKADFCFCDWVTRYIMCCKTWPEQDVMDIVENSVACLLIPENRRAMSPLPRHARASAVCATRYLHSR
jgi:hypothetical protein